MLVAPHGVLGPDDVPAVAHWLKVVVLCVLPVVGSQHVPEVVLMGLEGRVGGREGREGEREGGREGERDGRERREMGGREGREGREGGTEGGEGERERGVCMGARQIIVATGEFVGTS